MATTLRDEIVETVKWFVEQDLENHGYITESTKEIAKVQNVDLTQFEISN
jgi:hypothetical protein